MLLSSLPDVNSPDVFLAIGTPHELREQWRYNFAEWGGPFDIETYLRREELLLDQELTRSGGLIPWMLFYQPGRKGPRKILCGCETIDKQALVSIDGTAEEVTCNGVASVFCPEEYRGKGYAGRMMSDLAAKLADTNFLKTEGLQELRFSVLYSDIGKDFYAQRGWQVFPSAHISLRPSREHPEHNLPDVQYLNTDHIPQLCAAERSLLKISLSQAPRSRTTLAVIPDAKLMSWAHARSDFFAKELLDRTITIRGAIVDGSHGSKVWCIWQHVWSKAETHKDNKLYILYVGGSSKEQGDFQPASQQGVVKVKDTLRVKQVAALFAAAQSEAAEWGLNAVEIWNPSSVSLAAAQLLNAGVSVEHRNSSSIASLLWLGGDRGKDVDWVCNERYGWN